MDIPVKDLREALELVAPAVPKKATLPVCQSVLLADGKAYATNLEVGVTVQLGYETGDPFLIPFFSTYELLERIPGNEMLTLTPGKGSVILESGRTRAVLHNTQTVEEFPLSPHLEGQAEAVLDGTVLVKGLMEALPYAAREDSRPVLNSVCLALGDPVEVAAADGFRLARWQLRASLPHHEGKRLLLPLGAVRVLAHLWKGAGAAPDVGLEGSLADLATARRLLRLEYSIEKNQARFNFGKVSLYTQLIAGTFPNYAQLVPTDLPQRITFMGGDMRQALDLVKGMARDGSNIVRLSWEGEELTVMASATEVGEVAAQVRLLVPCTEGGRTAMDVKYLSAYLKGQEGIVTMGTKDPTSPVLFTTPGMPEVVMMPMSVQWDNRVPQPKGRTEEQVAEDGRVGVSSSPPDGDTKPTKSAAKKPRARRTRKAA